MRINQNIAALNAWRNLNVNQNALSKSLERLSSGLRINRAGDDAAGLAISEKMRAQVRGLNMASKNAQDGISLIQTAEGALNESHAILQRMRELATQSASDTNTAIDRAEIQKEVDQLAQELTRIADTTEFNTQNLLGGDLDVKFHIGANAGQNIGLKIEAMGAEALGVEGTIYEAQSLTAISGLTVQSLTGEDVTIEFASAGNDAVTETTAAFDGTDTITVTLKQGASPDGGTTPGTISDTHGAVLAALQAVAGEAGVKIEAAAGFDSDDTLSSAPALQTFAKANWTPDIEATKASGINVSSQTAADKAITIINDAIESVSNERSKLGAVQNRLEHTINNLGAAAENLQAAESRIRDADMAREMSEFTRAQILQQASTAMLAQANMVPQTVLQLMG